MSTEVMDHHGAKWKRLRAAGELLHGHLMASRVAFSSIFKVERPCLFIIFTYFHSKRVISNLKTAIFGANTAFYVRDSSLGRPHQVAATVASSRSRGYPERRCAVRDPQALQRHTLGPTCLNAPVLVEDVVVFHGFPMVSLWFCHVFPPSRS